MTTPTARAGDSRITREAVLAATLQIIDRVGAGRLARRLVRIAVVHELTIGGWPDVTADRDDAGLRPPADSAGIIDWPGLVARGRVNALHGSLDGR